MQEGKGRNLHLAIRTAASPLSWNVLYRVKPLDPVRWSMNVTRRVDSTRRSIDKESLLVGLVWSDASHARGKCRSAICTHQTGNDDG